MLAALKGPAAFALIPLGTFSAVAPAMLVVAREGARESWNAQDRLFLESGARILGASLRRFQRWQALETATLTDGLTGLRNRRALERLIADPGELGSSFRVWVADLHGFKTLNDSMGHAVGDLCLRQVAEVLLSQLRPADARFLCGAAALEFALVLPLLVMLLLGIVTGGVSYSRALGVTNAVREGARFGATATFSTATQATWASDTAARVRATQFDDSSSASSSSTSVCVEMVRTGTPNVSVYSSCSVGGSNAPTLTMPALGSYPETSRSWPRWPCWWSRPW